MKLSYCQLHVADGAAAQTISGTAAKMTGWATEGNNSEDNHGDKLVTPDLASDEIDVKAGHSYKVDVTISGTNSTAGDVQANLRAAGVEVVAGGCRANFAASNADNSMSFTCIYTATADAALSVYLEGAAADFTPTHGQFTVIALD